MYKKAFKTTISVLASAMVLLSSNAYSLSKGEPLSSGQIAPVEASSNIQWQDIHLSQNQSNSIMDQQTLDDLAQVGQTAEQGMEQAVFAKTSDSSVTDTVYEPKREKAARKIVQEDKTKRTYNSKHFLLEDGTYMARLSLGAVHYQDEEGGWEDINLALTDEADIDVSDKKLSKDIAKEARSLSISNQQLRKKGKVDRTETHYRALQLPFDVKLPKDYRKGYSIGKNQDKLSFIPVGANRSIGVVDAVYTNMITYPNAWNQTDVRLIVTESGIKEYIDLHDESAPTAFTFELNTKLSEGLTAGQLQVEELWLQDAKGETRGITPQIVNQGKKVLFQFEADTAGLQYPIMIDPSITVNFNADTYALQGAPAQNNNGPGRSLYAGFTSSTGYADAGADRVSGDVQTYLNFNYSSVASRTIDSVSLNLFYTNFRKYCCVNGTNVNGEFVGIKAYRVTSPWQESTLTWNNKPTDTPTNASGVVTIYDTAAVGYKTWDVTGIIKDSISAGQYYGIVLKPYSWSQFGGYAQFAPSGYLDITYDSQSTNKFPNQPTNARPGGSMSSFPAATGPTPTLQWTFSDPDAGDAQSAYQVIIYDTVGVIKHDSGWVTSSASTFAVPAGKLTPGAKYYWKVAVKDTKGYASVYSAPLYIQTELYEPNDTAAAAISVQTAKKYNAYIHAAADVDYYAFTVSKAGRYYLSLNLPLGMNYDVVILDDQQTVVSQLNQPPAVVQDVKKEVTALLQAGKTYYVKVFGVNGAYSSNSAYYYSFRISDSTVAYEYDSRNRLITRTVDMGLFQYKYYYSYDNNGNLLNSYISSYAFTQ